MASMLFFTGLIVALLRVCSEYFRSIAGRSLANGLFAGMLSGVIGGVFGFGWHQDGYVEHQLYRTFLCIVFATPIGGLAGLSLFVLHPKVHINWRKHLGGILLARLLTFGFIGLALIYFIPTMEARGIIISDLQLIFEIYLLVLFILTAFSNRWNIRKSLGRVVLLLLSVMLARLTTFMLPIPLSHIHHEGHRLYEWEYTTYHEDNTIFVFTIVTLLVWAIITYAVLIKDYRLTKYIDHLSAA